MSKHVKDGVLVSASPSSIDAFDPTTPFGCPRRWFFEYVKGMRGEESPAMGLGSSLHSAIEHHILHNSMPKRGPWPVEVDQLFLAVKPTVDQIIAEGINAVEKQCDLTLAGVRINGRIDIITKTGILDWKTTSDIGLYAKTVPELRRATPMILYTKWLHDGLVAFGKPLPYYTMEHVYVQTKKKPLVERVMAKITPGMLDVATDEIILLLERMKVAAGETDVTKFDRAAPEKCNRCPFKPICPTNGSKQLMSLLNRLKPAEAAPSILPADAPASDPALAALPVEGFSTEAEAAPTVPAPEAPSRRGRPKGSKNAAPAKSEPVAIPDLEFTTVTITLGATVPTVAYGNQRFDVSLTAKFSGSVEAATEEVSKKTRELLLKEVERFALTPGSNS